MPQTNVYVSGIKNGSYSVKLIFADGVTSDIDKNFFIEEPSDITTRVIFKDGKGKLQLIGMEPTKGTIQEESAVIYRPNDTAVYTDAIAINQTVTTTNTSTTTTTNTTNQSGNMNGETINMNVGINAGGTTQGMNVNINVNDPTMNTQMTSGNVQQTQMTTTTTSVTTSGTQTQTQMNQNTATGTNQVVSNSPTSISCKNILDNADKMVEDLKDLMMDEDRVDAIKLDLEKHCLTASQAFKIVETLNFEDNRLEASKYLYDRMIDKDKANTLLSLFNFDSSKMEFREYINKKK
jgi:hypothetical protein